MAARGVNRWLYPTKKGLYCEPGDFYIDPARAVYRAIITHGHSDHARPGHDAVLATPETIEVMKVRLGPRMRGSFEPLKLGTPKRIGGVDVRLAPAGHILGSAQVVLEHNGAAGRRLRRLQAPARPDLRALRARPLRSCSSPRQHSRCRYSGTSRPTARSGACSTRWQRNPERTHLVGVYGLGKCQRLIKLCRAGRL